MEKIRVLFNNLEIEHFNIINSYIMGMVSVADINRFQDILDDWKGNCKFVPANDARVFFASWNGQPISPYEYKDFESLIQYLTELMK